VAGPEIATKHKTPIEPIALADVVAADLKAPKPPSFLDNYISLCLGYRCIFDRRP